MTGRSKGLIISVSPWFPHANPSHQEPSHWAVPSQQASEGPPIAEPRSRHTSKGSYSPRICDQSWTRTNCCRHVLTCMKKMNTFGSGPNDPNPKSDDRRCEWSERVANFERDLIIYFQSVSTATAFYVKAMLGGVHRMLRVC